MLCSEHAWRYMVGFENMLKNFMVVIFGFKVCGEVFQKIMMSRTFVMSYNNGVLRMNESIVTQTEG